MAAMLLVALASAGWHAAIGRTAVRTPPLGFDRRAAPRCQLVPRATSSAKTVLLDSIAAFDEATASDGKPSVDFGVSGGELDANSRAPRDLVQAGAYYAVSDRVGRAADSVLSAIDDLASEKSPTAVPTEFFGSKAEGERSPLHGSWSNVFTTAADATFSSNSSRGDAEVFNSVDARSGVTFNVINFANGKEADREAPPRKTSVQQLRVRLSAKATSPTRIELVFRRVRVRLTTRLFGRRARLTLFIPVPGPFLTRLLFFFRPSKKPPPAFFDVLYIDEELRVHRTAQGNLFVQRRRSRDPVGVSD